MTFRLRGTASTSTNAVNEERPGSTAVPDAYTAWLVDEAKEAGKAIREILLLDEKMLASGFALFGTGSILALANNLGHLIMALPFALGILLTFSQYQHGLLLGLGGYKAALEEAIETRIGAPVSAWESVIAKKIHKNRGAISLRWISIAYFTAATAGAVYFAWDSHRPGGWGHEHSLILQCGIAGSIVIAGAAAGSAAMWARTQFDDVYGVTSREAGPRWIKEL